MYKDLEPELIVQSDETVEEFSIETSETDVIFPLSERLSSWLDIVDR